MVLMVPAGRMADRMGREKLFVGTLGLSLVLYACLIMVPESSPVLVIVLLFLFGGMLGIANPVGVAYGQELAAGSMSMVTGVLMGWAWAVGSLAPFAAGALARMPSLGATGALCWLGLGNVVALGLATALLGTRRAASG
jgi:MFS family permease